MATAAVMAILHPARGIETATLGKHQFAAASPAAPFAEFFADARRLAASTTPAWHTTDSDLVAWGPALIFPSLDRDVSTETVLDLAGPLTAPATAPTLLVRTLGLYAAKSRVPFVDTPALRQAIDRDLDTLEHATADLEIFSEGPETTGWGSIGAGAWLAYLELLYRDYFDLGDPGGRRWNANGLRILDQVLQRGRLEEAGGLRCDPRDAQAALWPTALAIYALVQAYQNEEVVRYESAAIDAAAAAENLRAADGGYFANPTKTTKDPRANAYFAGALLLLFKNSGDAQYRDRAVGILRWLTSAPVATSADAAQTAHIAYLTLLLDDVSMQPVGALLGRRPMRGDADLANPFSARAVSELARRLRPDGFRYAPLFDAVLQTLLVRVPTLAGDIAYDYGDAPGYAATLLLNGGERTVGPQIVTRQEQLARWPRAHQLEALAFGANAFFAAVDHPDLVDADEAQRALRRYLTFSGALAFADRFYLDWFDWLTGSSGVEYGPTVLGAQIAAAHLEYATRNPGQRVAWVFTPLAVGRDLIAGAERVAWDPIGHAYRVRPGDDVLTLLPNMMMIVDLLAAYRATGDAGFLAQAEAAAVGIEPLWDERHGAYVVDSIRSGEHSYESLSTNSYAALAQLRLYVATHKPAYRARAVRIIDWMSRDLYADGILYHHVYRGRRATGDIWCTGCNWRVLSLLMELAGSGS